MKWVGLLVGSLIATIFATSQPAGAAVPPDSCFDFDWYAAENRGYINGFYAHEGNNSANPACPTDVDIPETIGGSPVTNVQGYNLDVRSNDPSTLRVTSMTFPDDRGIELQNAVFYGATDLKSVELPNDLTVLENSMFGYTPNLESVVMPEGLTSIGNRAFNNSNIRSITIPASVQTIDFNAFEQSRLESMVFATGSSLTNINGSYQFQCANLETISLPTTVSSLDTSSFYQQGGNCPWDSYTPTTPNDIYYTRVYTENPNLQSQKNNIADGGFLINPAMINVSYRDSEGNTLAPSFTSAGKLADGTNIPDYRAINGPQDNVWGATPVLDAYYKLGSTQQITAPQIAGYRLQGQPTRSVTLDEQENTVNFVYVPLVSQFDLSTLQSPSGVDSSLSKALLAVNDGDCADIDNNSLSLISAKEVKSPEKVSLLGGVAFSLRCGVQGGASQVSLILDGADKNSEYRIYKQHGDKLTDITDRVTIDVSDPAKPVFSYTLTDGGDLDEDGTENGVVVDPVFIGVVDAGGSGLAETGVSIYLPTGVGAISLLAGFALVKTRLKSSRYL